MMSSHRHADQHWPDLTNCTIRQPVEREERPRNTTTSLASIEMYINAVYYPNFRASASQSPASLPLDTISHIFYAFAAVHPDGTIYLSSPTVDTQLPMDGTLGALHACTILKTQRPYLKLILSIGGAEGNQHNFAATAADPASRIQFAQSARQIIDQYQFDGIDVDWEHPESGAQARDYIQLLSVLRRHLPSPQYLVTTALPAGEWCLKRFDLRQLALKVDLLNLMGYDFCGGNWGETIVSGHHAALYAPHGGGSSAPAVQYLLSNGFPANKILLGCPTYGWSFLNCNNINQVTAVSGTSFDYALLPRPGTQELTDDSYVAAYCIGGDGGFVSYDSPRSVQAKARWAKNQGLAGVFFWHALSDAKGTRSLVYNSYMALHS